MPNLLLWLHITGQTSRGPIQWTPAAANPIALLGDADGDDDGDDDDYKQDGAHGGGRAGVEARELGTFVYE